MTICVIRSTEEHKLAGGMTEVLKLILKHFFGRPNGPDLRDGIVLNLPDGPRLVHGELSMLLADERGHKFTLQAK